jgi:hypothetical protein
MTTRNGVETEVRTDTAKRGTKKEWTGLLNGDVGDPLDWPPGTDRTVQVTGTLGEGGHVKITGSLDGGVTWAVLTDPTGNPLDFTAAGIKAITEHTLLVRPEVTAGDGDTDVIVIITAMRMRSP